jgi:hypothetical protein
MIFQITISNDEIYPIVLLKNKAETYISVQKGGE